MGFKYVSRRLQIWTRNAATRKHTRYVMASLQAEGKRNALPRELELSARPELADACDDLAFADELLRDAVCTDVEESRPWTCASVKITDFEYRGYQGGSCATCRRKPQNPSARSLRLRTGRVIVSACANRSRCSKLLSGIRSFKY